VWWSQANVPRFFIGALLLGGVIPMIAGIVLRILVYFAVRLKVAVKD